MTVMKRNSSTTETADTQEQSKSVLDILLKYGVMFWRYKKLMSIITAIGTFLIFTFCLLSKLLPPNISPMPNLYTARAVLLIDRDSSSGGLSSILSSYGMELGLGSSSSGDSIDLILTILDSRPFLDLLVEEFDIISERKIKNEQKTNSRQIIRNMTSHEYDHTSNTLTLTCSHTDPGYAADFVNRQIELLEEWYNQLGGQRAEKGLHLLEVQLANQESRIALLEDEIKEFQKENNTLSIEDLAALQAEMIADLRAQITQIDLQIQSAKQLSQAEIENENLINLRLQRNNLNYLILQLEKGYSGGVKIMPSAEEFPDLAIKYAKLQQEAEIQATIYQRLREQYEIAGLNQERADAFSVMEYAEVPEQKDSPRRSVIVIGGFFFSLLISILVAFILEYSGGVIDIIKEKIKNEQS